MNRRFQHAAMAAALLAGAIALPVAAQDDNAAFASDNFGNDDWGMFDNDFAWQTDDPVWNDWSVDDDWNGYGARGALAGDRYGMDDYPYNDDRYPLNDYGYNDYRYGDRYGLNDYGYFDDDGYFDDYDATGDLARNGDSSDRWAYDNDGPFTDSYAWNSDDDLGSWGERAHYDWYGYDDAGEEGWFDW